MENITLSSGSSSWAMKFNKTTINNLPINGSVKLQLVLNNTAMVPDGINRVPIEIKYSGGQSQDFVKVNITKYANFEIQQIYTAPGYNNGTSVLSYKLINTGNTEDNISLSMNSTSIQTLVHDSWNVSFQYNGKTISYITLNYSQTKVINVVFKPGKVPSPSFDITINANLTNTNVVRYVDIHYTSPDAPGITVYSKGPGIISNYTGDPFVTVEYGIIIIAIAVIGGIAGVAIRGRKRK